MPKCYLTYANVQLWVQLCCVVWFHEWGFTPVLPQMAGQRKARAGTSRTSGGGGPIYGDSACQKYSTIQSWSWGRLIGRVMASQCQPLYGHCMSGFVHHCICRALYGLWHLLVGKMHKSLTRSIDSPLGEIPFICQDPAQRLFLSATLPIARPASGPFLGSHHISNPSSQSPPPCAH